MKYDRFHIAMKTGHDLELDDVDCPQWENDDEMLNEYINPVFKILLVGKCLIPKDNIAHIYREVAE